LIKKLDFGCVYSIIISIVWYLLRKHLSVYFQLFSNDLELYYQNVTIEPYGDLTVDEGVTEREQYSGLYKEKVFCRYLPDFKEDMVEEEDVYIGYLISGKKYQLCLMSYFILK